MKFIISSMVLRKVLSDVTLFTKPILEHVLVEAEGSQLSFTATNLRSVITKTIPFVGYKPEPGRVLIHPEKLLKLLKVLEEQPLVISANEATFTVKYMGGQSTFAVSDRLDEWDQNPQWRYECTNPDMWPFPGELITGKTKWENFVGNDDLRPTLSHILCETKTHQDEGKVYTMMTAVATNAHLLKAKRFIHPVMPEVKFMLEMSLLKKIRKIYHPDDLKFLANEKFIWLDDGVTKIQSRVDNGPNSYPKWRNVIPSEHYHFTVDLKELNTAVDIVGITAAYGSKQILFKLRPENIHLESKDLDDESQSSYVIGAQTMGPHLWIGLNMDLLGKCLKEYKETRIRVDYHQPNRSVIITGESSGTEMDLTLIMPVLVNEPDSPNYSELIAEYEAGQPIKNGTWMDIFQVWRE